MNKNEQLIIWFNDVGNDDVELVGGKNASLGEMYRTLSQRGVRVPNGFIVTAYAYRDFIEKAGLKQQIEDTINSMQVDDTRSLQETGKKVREMIVAAELPEELNSAIIEAYRGLSGDSGTDSTDVAVRSSATAEDLPGASFAGEHDTFLNVRGDKYVLRAVKMAMASLFNDRAISYRVHKGFGHFQVALSVGIQKMVRSDKGSSGVMFTIDTDTGFENVIQISASWGLGEMVVQGKVNPDEYMIFKPMLGDQFAPVIKKTLGAKRNKMIYSENAAKPIKQVPNNEEERNSYVLSNDEILQLAKWGAIIEGHYSERYGKYMPMDIEWAKDGETGELFIVQARPETVQSEKSKHSIIEYSLKTGDKPVVQGIAVGTKIASGNARIIESVEGIHSFEEGEILVTKITDPDWEPIMKKASAIITERGGRTSHAAIVSRELGIPAVIGATRAMTLLETGETLTIDTSSGTTGSVYKGKLEWTETVHEIASIPETKTKVSMNVGSPESALVHSQIPNDGVGLAREEFVIASQIRIHPNALINFESLPEKLKKKIDKMTLGHVNKQEFFVDKLAEGIGQIAAAFWPKQVIVRFSDFKTNEYATLTGGELYEPEEENPMIGWRGASRYAHPDFTEAFKLECAAVKKIREVFGLTNLAVMVPFCRTPEEGMRVLDIMREAGLEKGANGLMVYVMCELPTNVIRADDFLDIFDGFSIGSNDLAQLTLGLDRDSAIVAGISNENDPAVRDLVSRAIKACKNRGKYIGFCGQAPSDYKDFLRFLIREGIDSVSLIPDTVIPMKFEISEEEKNLENNN
jgi:pyruvate, water dikinase